VVIQYKGQRFFYVKKRTLFDCTEYAVEATHISHFCMKYTYQNYTIQHKI